MIDSLKYLEMVRQLPCLVCGQKADAHHLKAIGMGRDRKDDLLEHFTAIPLCRIHHDEFENIGLRLFNYTHSVDCWREAFRLAVGI